MLHPIFATVLGHPELIADHASNYASLARQEAVRGGRALLELKEQVDADVRMLASHAESP